MAKVLEITRWQVVGGHDSNHTVTRENHRSIKLQFWTKVRGVIQVQTRRQLQVSEPLFCQNFHRGTLRSRQTVARHSIWHPFVHACLMYNGKVKVCAKNTGPSGWCCWGLPSGTWGCCGRWRLWHEAPWLGLEVPQVPYFLHKLTPVHCCCFPTISILLH